MWPRLNHINPDLPSLARAQNDSLPEYRNYSTPKNEIDKKKKKKLPDLLLENETLTLCWLDGRRPDWSVRLTLSGSAGYPVRLQDESFRAAAPVRPVGVCAGLAACAIHGAFIMIWRREEESHL